MAETTFENKINEITQSIPVDKLNDDETPAWAKYMVGSLVTSFKGLCVELTKLNQNFSQRIDQLEVRNSINEAKIKSLEDQKSRLEAKLDDKCEEFELRIDDNAQYSRRNCLLLHGVPENERENIDLLLSETLNHVGTLNLNLDIENVVDRAHRIGKPTKGRVTRNNKQKVRPIIIKFTSYRTRSKVFFSKKNLKGSGLMITESLTHRRYDLLKAAQEKFGFKSVWSIDGKIMANVDDRKIISSSQDDLM